MAQTMKVVDPANPNRTLFEGPDDAARDFVEQHAPRPHATDGVDVPGLVLENGEYWNGTDWVKPKSQAGGQK